MFSRFIGVFALAGFAWAAPEPSAAQASSGIGILTGEFGTLGAKRKLSIVASLQKRGARLILTPDGRAWPSPWPSWARTSSWIIGLP